METSPRSPAGDAAGRTHFDVIVIGAGFAGLYALHRLRGAGLSVRVFEAGPDLGGTWYWNCYPGARCDVESLQYSYSFSEELQQEWVWSERHATQPEILAYINHVADRFDLRRDIEFNARIAGAQFDTASNHWTVRTDGGATVSANFCVMATGALSASRLPDIPGIETFAGPIHHTGRWPKGGVDLSGKRVGVIGTGSSGIQVIPILAAECEQLVVFQRTPAFSIPARNVPLTAAKQAAWKKDYRQLREKARTTRTGGLYECGIGTQSALEVSAQEREREYERRWQAGGTNFLYAYADIARNPAANDTAADFVRAKIAALVRDPATAAKLTPKDYPLGAKRISLDTDYYATFNRDNVTLVDLRTDPIEHVTATSVKTRSAEHPLDALVCATGFDALTGALLALDIRGTGGISLKQKWSDGPRTNLGIMVAGFPNLFIVTGPGSPSVLSNMVSSIEHHVDWIADCLMHVRSRAAARIESTERAETEWVERVNDVAGKTLYAQVNSWYTGANIPGKPKVFMPFVGGVDVYRRLCAEVAAAGYPGFDLGR